MMSGATWITMDRRRAKEFRRLDPRLVSILLDIVAEHWPEPFIEVTSIWRSKEEEEEIARKTGHKTSGIHNAPPPYRAMDIRVTRWKDSEVVGVVNRVNATWQYDPDRQGLLVALYRPHGTGPHLHLQVHPNTRRREEA